MAFRVEKACVLSESALSEVAVDPCVVSVVAGCVLSAVDLCVVFVVATFEPSEVNPWVVSVVAVSYTHLTLPTICSV